MVLHRIRLLFAAFAVTLIAAPAFLSAEEPASLSATGPAADHVNTQSTAWQEHWEPCFKDRPADRIVAMRGWDTMIGLSEELRNAMEILSAAPEEDAVYDEAWIENIVGGSVALRDRAKLMRIADDFESVANHGCSGAQAMMGAFRGIGLGRRADWLEALKWLMLAEKPGFAPVQELLINLNSDFNPEDIATARAMAEAWRPGD